MKKFIITALFTVFTSTAALAALPAVLAKVNGHDVTSAEIEKAFSAMAMEQPGQKKLTFDKTPADFQKAFVEKYIEKALIIDAAREANLQNDPEIKKKLKEAEDFLIQQKFLTDIVIKKKSDAELQKIYDDKLKGKEGSQEVHAMHILVKTEDEAIKLRQTIKDGADFEKMAKQKSIEPGAKISGGDLGYFTADQMLPEFSKAAFNLNKGEISEPVKTNFGWHIIKVLDKRAKKIPSFAAAKPALEKQLAGDLIEDEVKRLKIAADIEYFGALKNVAKEDTKPLVKKVADIKPEEKMPDEVKPPVADVAAIEPKKEEKRVQIKAKPVVKKPQVAEEEVEEEDAPIVFEEKFENGSKVVKGKAE